MGNKAKYYRPSVKADQVSEFMKANPGATLAEVRKAFDVSYSYANKLYRSNKSEWLYNSMLARRAERAERKAGMSDGSTARYYEVPDGVSELQHLISYKDMNAQIGEIFRSCYRFGQASHSDRIRDAKKIKFYAEAEIERLINYQSRNGNVRP